MTQNARAEQAQVYRHWEEFTAEEKAAALRGLAKFMRGKPHWSQEAGAVAVLTSMHLDMEGRTPSPVVWSELTRPELKTRLLEIAAWDDGAHSGDAPYLRDACLDLADDLNRQRSKEREGRER